MKANPQRCHVPGAHRSIGGAIFLSAALLSAIQPVLAQSTPSQARMSQMLNQFEQGKRPTYSTSGGYSRGAASGMPGYANMMGGKRPSNMGGYAGHGSGGSSQMMQLMRAKMARMQSGGGGGGGNSLMQLMRQRQGGAPNMMPGMGGGPGAGMGMQSGLFAKMMQQDSAFNNAMRRNQMNQGMGRPGMMGMKRPGMGMARPGGMGMGLGTGMGMSGAGRPGGMGMSGAGMLGRMQPKTNAPRAGSPFAPKQATPAKSNTMSDLEKAMESQYGK